MRPEVERILLAELEKRGRPVALLYSYIQLLVACERWDDIETLYREAIQKNAKDFVAQNNLAELLALRGRDLDEALSLINAALDFAGESISLLDTRAVVHLARRTPGLALDDMLKVVTQEESKQPNHYFHLAQVYAEANQPIEAKRALREAQNLGLDPSRLHPLERSQLVKLADRLNQND